MIHVINTINVKLITVTAMYVQTVLHHHRLRLEGSVTRVLILKRMYRLVILGYSVAELQRRHLCLNIFAVHMVAHMTDTIMLQFAIHHHHHHILIVHILTVHILTVHILTVHIRILHTRTVHVLLQTEVVVPTKILVVVD